MTLPKELDGKQHWEELTGNLTDWSKYLDRDKKPQIKKDGNQGTK